MSIFSKIVLTSAICPVTISSVVAQQKAEIVPFNYYTVLNKRLIITGDGVKFVIKSQVGKVVDTIVKKASDKYCREKIIKRRYEKKSFIDDFRWLG